jgi:hypothetical protein
MQGRRVGHCLTAPQVAALKKLYAGGRNSNGQIFPGYSPGGEAEFGGWAVWITGPSPERSLMYAFSTQFYKNMVFDNAAWDYHTFDADRDTKAAEDKQNRNLNATDPNLSRFRERGGKLILYHGWSDAAIAPQNTIDYYGSVAAKMGASADGRFVRLFMVPGMQHCGGGSGPNSFGQFRRIRRCRSRFGCRAGALGRKRRRPRAHRGRQAQERPGPRPALSCARARCARIRWWRATRAAAAPTTRPTSCAPSRTGFKPVSTMTEPRTVSPPHGSPDAAFPRRGFLVEHRPGQPAAGCPRHRPGRRISPPRAPWYYLRAFARVPHPVGSAAHDAVRDYIVQQLSRRWACSRRCKPPRWSARAGVRPTTPPPCTTSWRDCPAPAIPRR